MREGQLYRQINLPYKPHYDRLMASGLYDALVRAGLLIPHEEAAIAPECAETCYKVLKPERIPFISYPYEWCFSQLKRQALALLEVQRLALDRGMSLKDASAFNMQFRQGRPVLIDTSSFEQCADAEPWVAYRQFCEHFLAPLVLTKYRHPDLSKLSRIYLDGVPLGMASRLLPLRARMRPSVFLHIALHGRWQRRYAERNVCGTGALARADAGSPPSQPGAAVPHVPHGTRPMKKRALLGLIANLEGAVSGLNWQPKETAWSGYYERGTYSAEALEHKRAIVAEFLDRVKPACVWDLGASTGLMSRIATERGIFTVALEGDSVAVETCCRDAIARSDPHLLPLADRGPADLALALALMHHLAITHNVPFRNLASWLRSAGRALIIEFVPKEDPQVRRMLASRKDVFGDYTQQEFETRFGEHFRTLEVRKITGSPRSLYLMQRKD